MSDPTLSDLDFKNNTAWVWTTLNYQFFETWVLNFSKVNIMIPDENGEYLEKPVVEQFRTYWDPKKKILITEPVEIAA